MKKFSIGRAPRRGPLTHACDISFDEGAGRASIENETDLRPGERAVLDLHFSMPITVLGGGGTEDTLHDGPVRLYPGTQAHFAAAAHQLPNPFMRMPT